MASQADIPALLRFLSQDAKVPLAAAMSFVKPLQSSSLASPALLASSNLATLTPIFKTQDDAKKVLNAAKRKAKRPAANDKPSPSKKRKVSPGADAEIEPHELEASLALPEPVTDETLLISTTLITNRAPLLLAFMLTLLEYTMPRQPLSSRLSLAQAQVSQGARAKAKSLGIEKGVGAEEEGWGTGQPAVNVMGKEVRIVRRAGYPLEQIKSEVKVEPEVKEEGSGEQQSKSQAEQRNEERITRDANADDEQYALWALDLEALRSSKTDMVSSTSRTDGGGLPIFSPHSARAYILKAFASAPSKDPDPKAEVDETDSRPSKPKKPKSEAKQKEENLGLLLGALKLLFASWASILHSLELSRRAWTWYMNIRPTVEHGPAGWGGKGEVRLRSILDLRRSRP